MIKFLPGKVKFLLVTMVVVGIGNPATAGSFTLDAQTSDINKLDLGIFASGTRLDVKLSGTISLTTLSSFNPDGSMEIPDPAAIFSFAIAGASGYPTKFGGDGINHFAGGGLNYDVLAFIFNINPFGIAGKETTDTKDPDAIRLGSVVGTFSKNPSRNDWFFIGLGRILTVPKDGSHLYVAVNDTYYFNSTGAYLGTIDIIPPSEPVPERKRSGGANKTKHAPQNKVIKLSRLQQRRIIRTSSNFLKQRRRGCTTTR
ncbi:hypothetical protein [Microcoleus sp. Pol12B4]|uniref:hypothetical protein n=1 Tax=Microcoleus sp. Pol12B4 TaxID=3055395 RepID=UPI002FD2899A